MGRPPGRFCWVCERRRPNERFGGKGRRAHIGVECRRKYTRAEIAVRQVLRDVERIPRGILIGHRERQRLEVFRSHPEPRVREAVDRMVALDAEERAARRAAWIEVEREDELCVEMQLRIASEPEMPRQAPDPGLVDEDIPF